MTTTRRPEPLFDVDPRTGASIEVFYADRRLETFGRDGVGWFWWPRRRGWSPDGSPIGPFATSYAAFRHAMKSAAPVGDAPVRRLPTDYVDADTVRTHQFLGGDGLS
jgi:hypothetical protein